MPVFLEPTQTLIRCPPGTPRTPDPVQKDLPPPIIVNLLLTLTWPIDVGPVTAGNIDESPTSPGPRIIAIGRSLPSQA